MKNTSTRQRSRNGGAAMMIAIVFFLLFSSLIAYGIAGPLISRIGIASDFRLSRQSLFVAEAGLEDMDYRITNGKTYANSETLGLNGATTTLSVTSITGGLQVASSGNASSRIRSMQAQFLMGGGVGFNYGLQGGNGGVDLSGGSSIIGNIYANGSIHAISASITGTAVAADSAPLAADQTNDSPATPPTSDNFRNATASQDFAQSFQVSDENPVYKVQFYMKKTGSPANATVIIAADSGGSPASTALASVTMSASLVTTSFGWVEIVFPTPLSLISGTTYWILIQNGSVSSSAYYTIGSNTSYASGQAKTGKYGGSWTALNRDGYFKLYTGGVSSYIGGATYSGGVTVGTSGVGDAWASSVQGASVQGSLYCTTGTNNNKTCNTTRGSPPPQPMPFSDANIQSWKDDAAAGAALGATTVGSAGATLGPAKISGNLVVNGGGTLTLNGPLWVTGSVTITNGGKVKLPAGYARNSETIIADGTISVTGGGSAGSGTSGSFLFMVSTSRCPNDISCGGLSAINISGGAGAIAANAQDGTVALSGGAAINSVVGNMITVTGGSTITYDAGLASPSFQSGPSGGYVLDSWLEN